MATEAIFVILKILGQSRKPFWDSEIYGVGPFRYLESVGLYSTYYSSPSAKPCPPRRPRTPVLSRVCSCHLDLGYPVPCLSGRHSLGLVLPSPSVGNGPGDSGDEAEPSVSRACSTLPRQLWRSQDNTDRSPNEKPSHDVYQLHQRSQLSTNHLSANP